MVTTCCFGYVTSSSLITLHVTNGLSFRANRPNREHMITVTGSIDAVQAVWILGWKTAAVLISSVPWTPSTRAQYLHYFFGVRENISAGRYSEFILKTLQFITRCNGHYDPNNTFKTAKIFFSFHTKCLDNLNHYTRNHP